MTIPKAIEDAFFRRERVAPLQFGLNDTVTMTGGDSRGKTGFVVSIVSTEPEVVFLVEREDGLGDVRVRQADLAPTS